MDELDAVAALAGLVAAGWEGQPVSDLPMRLVYRRTNPSGAVDELTVFSLDEVRATRTIATHTAEGTVDAVISAVTAWPMA